MRGELRDRSAQKLPEISVGDRQRRLLLTPDGEVSFVRQIKSQWGDRGKAPGSRPPVAPLVRVFQRDSRELVEPPFGGVVALKHFSVVGSDGRVRPDEPGWTLGKVDIDQALSLP